MSPVIRDFQRDVIGSTMTPVPFLDLQAQFAEIRAEMLLSVERVLESQHFILGSEVKALETDLAPLVECQLAISCAFWLGRAPSRFDGYEDRTWR